MNKQLIVEFLNKVDPGAISAFLFGIACILLGFYLIRRTSKAKVMSIVNGKKYRETAVLNLIDELQKMDSVNRDLIKQMSLLESFENDTINEGINLADAAIQNVQNLNFLNDTKLSTNAKFYFAGQLKLLSELIKLENESYDFQREYQQRVIYYNREYDKIKETVVDDELLLEYKKEISAELDFIKENVLVALRNLKNKRDEFLKEINTSQSLAHKLKTAALDYKNKQVSRKKFYLQYLSFA